MNHKRDVIREFLAHMGIDAEVRVDKFDGELIVIETVEYQRQRSKIESWFTLIDQDQRYSYFRQRPRGTGTTML